VYTTSHYKITAFDVIEWGTSDNGGNVRIVITFTDYSNQRYSSQMKLIEFEISYDQVFLTKDISTKTNICGTKVKQSLTSIITSCPAADDGIGRLALFQTDDELSKVAEWKGDDDDQNAGEDLQMMSFRKGA
jgi:hypothetical protein